MCTHESLVDCLSRIVFCYIPQFIKIEKCDKSFDFCASCIRRWCTWHTEPSFSSHIKFYIASSSENNSWLMVNLLHRVFARTDMCVDDNRPSSEMRPNGVDMLDPTLPVTAVRRSQAASRRCHLCLELGGENRTPFIDFLTCSIDSHVSVWGCF